jgi:hypothetical protein
MAKTKLSSWFEGTHCRRWKDELVECTTRPPKPSLKAGAGRSLLILIIERVCLVGSHSHGAHKVGYLCTVLLQLRQHPRASALSNLLDL